MGLNRSFHLNLLFPLYYTFFKQLGFDVIMPDQAAPGGAHKTKASFCYPAEIAHGMFAALLNKNPDHIFLPLLYELHVEESVNREPGHQSACIISQGEPFYLKSAFPQAAKKIISPLLDFSRGWEAGEKAFVETASKLGCDASAARRAFAKALQQFKLFLTERKKIGAALLADLRSAPGRIGIVLFGRSYNAFVGEGNLGIPQKFASRGVHVIPYDCLPFFDEPCIENMTWASGQDIVRAAHFVKKDPLLFGAYITNFSCGPDSFLVGYFRDIMQSKPSLTLEIDSHSADAGINTRIEAFLDIIERYRKLKTPVAKGSAFKKAELVRRRSKVLFRSSTGREYSIKDGRVKVVFPSMGTLVSGLGAAAFRGMGINAHAVPRPDFETLMRGRQNTSCKECLPLILTTGSLLEYVERVRPPEELTLYFMPTTNGGCRFAQYYVFLNRLIEKKQIPDVVTFTLTSENGYSSLGVGAVIKLLKAVLVSDALDDIRNALYVLARDREAALKIFELELRKIIHSFERGCRGLSGVLKEAALQYSRIPLKQPPGEAPRVLLAGEIFVRKDEFSSNQVVEALARRGIITQRAPVLEWTQYIDLWVEEIEQRRMPLAEKIEFKARLLMQRRIEHEIKSILAGSKLYHYEPNDIREVVATGENYVNRWFGGETILVVGRFFKDILKRFDGLISIGPFACLPTRVIEAILNAESDLRDNALAQKLTQVSPEKGFSALPFLSVESDGCPFPQVIEARLEAFCLQVERAREKCAGSTQRGCKAATKK